MSTTSLPAAGATDAPTVALEISGMSCGHCVAAVQSALHDVPGVLGTRVAIGSAQVTIDPTTAAPDAIARAAIEAIRDAGYDARLAGDGSSAAPARPAGLPVLGACCGSRR